MPAYSLIDEDGTVRWQGAISPAPGGSQPFRVETASIDYTEFTQEDDEKILFTPAAGEWLVKAWGDVANAVSFDDSGSIDFSVNEDPPGPIWDHACFWQFLGNGIGVGPDPNNGGGPFDSDSGASAAKINSIATHTGTRQFAGGPVKIRAQSVFGDGTTGHCDLFFLIWTPPA